MRPNYLLILVDSSVVQNMMRIEKKFTVKDRIGELREMIGISKEHYRKFLLGGYLDLASAMFRCIHEFKIELRTLEMLGEMDWNFLYLPWRSADGTTVIRDIEANKFGIVLCFFKLLGNRRVKELCRSFQHYFNLLPVQQIGARSNI